MRQLFLAVILLAAGMAFAQKPPSGPPAGNPQPDEAARRRQEEEEARHRPYIEACQARDRADLARAAFEKAHRPGPLAEDTKAEFEQVVAAFKEAVNRPITSPDVADVVMYCHLRYAGVYQYIGQFDKAVDIAKDAAKTFAGEPKEIEAVQTVGLIYLQAKHDPKEALPWFERARDLVPTIREPNTQSKWRAAAEEGLARCKAELEKGKAKAQ